MSIKNRIRSEAGSQVSEDLAFRFSANRLAPKGLLCSGGLEGANRLVPVLHGQSNLSWWENFCRLCSFGSKALNLKPYTLGLKSFYLALAFLLFSFSLSAQIYPVQVSPVLVPPYSLNTSDYYNGTSERLAVVLTNTDLQKPVLNVRLRMYIEGQNAKLQSRDGVYFPTITLDAGIPQRISLGDLAPYFNIDNLNLSGITRAMYAQNGKLPEGFYSFCFEAIEVNTGQVLSRKSCSMAYITLSDPPFLNLPVKGESLASREVQNIIFQWTPRNLASPNGAFNTEYEFTLKELWDTGIAPEAAFESRQPLYQVTLRPTTLLMGPAEPQLMPGKRYAWRVRAVSTSPTGEQADSYRNNGFSEIYWFTYQSDCKPPVALNSSVSSGRATIKWEASPSGSGTPAGGYTLQYREKSLSGSKWYSVNTLENRAMLYDLKPGNTYEYRVGSSCVAGNIGIGTDQATYSDILTLEINGNPNDTATINCGMISPEIAIANRTPIQTLNQGDLIMAGGFPVKLISVTGSGNFSGAGYVTIPMLGQANVKVRFSNIQVNTERQLFGGVIETTYNPREEQVADVDTIKKDLVALGKAIGKIVNGIFTDIKTNIENDVIANKWLKEFEKAVDDPANKISEEVKKAIREKIADGSLKEHTVKAIAQAREDFASGKNDDIIKQSLVSNFTNVAGETKKSSSTLNRNLAFANITPDERTTNLTAYLSPKGEPIYLNNSEIDAFLNDPNDGTLIGFSIKGQKFVFDEDVNRYKSEKTDSIYKAVKLPSNGTIPVLLVTKKNCLINFYTVNITYPNSSGSIPSISSAKLNSSKTIIGCSDKIAEFFGKEGTAYVTRLEKIEAIIEYFKKCGTENWAAYGNGILPYCFWKNSNTEQNLYYTSFDIPYRVGIIDGAYGQVKGIIDLRENVEKIVYAYAIGSMGCENLLDDVEDYNILLDEIKKLSKEKGILNCVEKAFKEYKAKSIADHAKECIESNKIIEKTSQTIDNLYEIVADDGKLLDIGITIAQKLGTYVNKVSGNDEIARYEKGKLTAEVLALFIGTEEVSVAKKMAEFERFLARAAEAEKVGVKVAERTGQHAVLKGLAENGGKVGEYTTKIRWGILDVEVRPFGKGFLGKRTIQSDARVNAFEMKINPNNESFYLPHPEGGYVQFENIVNSTVQDGKLIMDKSSIYYVLDKPEFLNKSSVLEPALRQLKAANASGYKVEWLVSDEKAVQQITQYFKDNNVNILVKIFKE